MLKYIICVCLLCGCAFDLSALDGQDAEGPDSAVVDAAPLQDASDAEAGILADAEVVDSGTDASFDSGSDSGMLRDAEPDSGPPPLTCLDVPAIAGTYRITRRLMGCYDEGVGPVPLIRLDSCEYEFEDSSPTPVFDGPCEVIIEGPTYRYECDIKYNVWNYRCSLEPVSGGLNIHCQFVRGTAPPTTDPCSFFAPSA